MKHKNIGYALLAGSVLFGFTFATGAYAENKHLAVCESCHGKDGNNPEIDVPNIASYSPKYFSMTIEHYKGKERPCIETKIRTGPKKGSKTDMCQIAKDLTDKDVEELAAYFSAQKFKRFEQKFDAAKAEKGKYIHEKKGCEKCHSMGGSVADDDNGILAGQKEHYLKEQTEFFLAGKRPMHKKMKPKLEKLSPEEVEEVLQYYASQK